MASLPPMHDLIDKESPQDRSELGDEKATDDQAINASATKSGRNPVTNQDEEAEEIEVDLKPTARKKRSRKPASKRGIGKPTGFEEYNAHGPLTVEEYQLDSDIYDLKYPFIVRIMTAIQRYEGRRRMSSEQRDIFYKYLVYGGIDVGPNMFQGLDPADRKEMDKEDLVTMLAQTSISDDKRNIGEEGSSWVIDIKGVMESFISRRVTQLYDLPTYESVKLITTVLSNFMSYLLHHNVCPEFKGDLLDTRSFLDKDAPRELWNVKQAQRWMPGDFNIACSTLFGGFYAKNYDGATSWGHEKDTDQPDRVFVGMTDEEARNVAKFAIAAAASEEQTYAWVDYANANIVAVESIVEGAFKITKVYPLTPETKQFYKEESPGYRPVGRVLARKWTAPTSRDEDLTDAEKKIDEYNQQKEEQENKSPSASDMTVYSFGKDYDYEFFLEAQILQYCVPGMKVEATIYKLNCGIMFFDTVGRVYCSFDRFLPNEMMLDYTKPRAVGVKAEEEESVVAAAAAERARLEWEDEQRRAEARIEDGEDEMNEKIEDKPNEDAGQGSKHPADMAQPGHEDTSLSDPGDHNLDEGPADSVPERLETAL